MCEEEYHNEEQHAVQFFLCEFLFCLLRCLELDPGLAGVGLHLELEVGDLSLLDKLVKLLVQMPLHRLYLHPLYHFTDSCHLVVQIRLLKLEKRLRHLLLLTVLHVNVYQEQTKRDRTDRDYYQPDCKIVAHLLNRARPFLIALTEPVDPRLHYVVEIVLDLPLVLSPTCLSGRHQYPIQS